jgi:GntR family transcriptional regulator, transcriptional repressor for pyruvate dehydrogenase complex
MCSAELAEKISVIAKKRRAFDHDSLEKVTHADNIVPILVKYIGDRKLAEGDKLPTEAELSMALEVGTRSVREALTTLKALGVVNAQRGAGWYVTEFKPLINLPTILAPLLEHFHGITAHKVFEVRLKIEPIIAELATKNITPEGLLRLGETLETMRKSVEEKLAYDEFRLADRKFHDILAEACGNEVWSLQNSLLSSLFLSMSILPPKSSKYTALREHEEIYKKVEDRDTEGAAAAAKRHVESAIQFIDNCGSF